MSFAMEDRSPPHPITVDEFYRMVETGLVDESARVELVEGAIIDMAPIGPPHGFLVDTLARLLFQAVGERAILRSSGSVRLSNWSEFLPDIALLKPWKHSYSKRVPLGPDTLLVVEVSDSSLRYDRYRKAPLYARHGFQELWIVDAKKKVIHFYRGRTPSGYADITVTARPGITPLPLANLTVDLTGLFRPGWRRERATSG